MTGVHACDYSMNMNGDADNLRISGMCETLNNAFVFTIPLVAKGAAPCWESVTRNLTNTLRSVAHQQDPNVIVLLCGHDLPSLPRELCNSVNLVFLRADFPLPGDFGKEGMGDRRRKYQLMGMWLRHNIKHTRYCMFLDADDWLCGGLCERIRRSPSVSWAIRKGFKYDVDNDVAALHESDMIKSCGSTFVFQPTPEFFPIEQKDKNNLWSRLISPHSLRPQVMNDHGIDVEDLAEPYIVYLVNHENSHRQHSDRAVGKTRSLEQLGRSKRISSLELRSICGVPAPAKT
jgi:hypothetical protein